MAKKKKLPNDYPLLGYRVRPHIKELLTEQLDAVVRFQNTKLALRKPFKKNDVFVEALERGLKVLREERMGSKV